MDAKFSNNYLIELEEFLSLQSIGGIKMQILNINKSITGEYNSTSECSYNQGAMYTTKYLIPYNVDFSSELMFSKSKFRRLTTNNVEKIMYINRKKNFLSVNAYP